MNEAAPRRSIFGSVMLIGGGLAAVGGAIFAVRKSNKTVDDLSAAINGTAPPAVLVPPDPSDPPGQPPQVESGTGGVVAIHTTGYWPYKEGLTDAQRKMEGGTNDRKGNKIITLEMYQSDPNQYKYVSVAGDYTIWPYGQRISIDAWPNVVFRVVDTGGHFFGAKKVYRVAGEEPLDIAVNGPDTYVPKSGVTAKIFPGDNFAGGKAVATGGLKGQTVTAGEITEARTSDDYEALARSLESELGGRPREEQIVAGWAIRNRADVLGVSVSDLLAPNGQYGSPQSTGGFTSTRRPSTEKSREASVAVLGASSDTDPTDGAVDFWVPAQQARMRILGDVYRAAAKNGDVATAQKYVRFAGYGSEGDVRVKQAKDGMRLIDVVGSVELLGKIR